MSLIFYSKSDPWEDWAPALRRELPDLDLRHWEDSGDDAAVRFALVWRPPEGELRDRFPNLEYIFSLGAGVDALLADPSLPEGAPVVRMVEEALIVGMTEFVTLHVLRHHRRQRELADQQRDKVWAVVPTPLAPARRVGLMGLGVLGADAARVLTALHFDVASWSRTPKSMDGVTSFHGPAGLDEFLARTEILVALLPLTPDTRGILDRSLFDRLPQGACLINAGRGGLQVETDILAALESGRLAEATLDVFETEPLAPESPLWTHPRVVVSPHMASISSPSTGAAEVASNIRRIEAGEPPHNIVDRKVGY